jgi:hypothetical protein
MSTVDYVDFQNRTQPLVLLITFACRGDTEMRELPSLTVGLLTLNPVKSFQNILCRQTQNHWPSMRAGGW